MERVFGLALSIKKSLDEISSLFDSVYVSFYKDLDGIAGAMLVGTVKFDNR
jgi:threonine aldolase